MRQSIFKTSKFTTYQMSNLKSVCKTPRDLLSQTSDMAPVTCLAVMQMCFLLRFVKIGASVCISVFPASRLHVDCWCSGWHGKRLSSHSMLCSILMSSGVPSSLAMGYFEYFPVSSLKPHRRLIVILENNSQYVKQTKLQFEPKAAKQPRMTCVRNFKTWRIILLVTRALSVVKKITSLVASSWKRDDLCRSVGPSVHESLKPTWYVTQRG